MPKDALSDAEAELLIQKLNRRMSALAVLTQGPRHIPWSVLLFEVLIFLTIGGWMFWAEEPDSSTTDLVGYLLLAVIPVLVSIVQIYNANLNKRIDALVELLQQEGLLHPELRPDSAKKP